MSAEEGNAAAAPVLSGPPVADVDKALSAILAEPAKPAAAENSAVDAAAAGEQKPPAQAKSDGEAETKKPEPDEKKPAEDAAERAAKLKKYQAAQARFRANANVRAELATEREAKAKLEAQVRELAEKTQQSPDLRAALDAEVRRSGRTYKDVLIGLVQHAAGAPAAQTGQTEAEKRIAALEARIKAQEEERRVATEMETINAAIAEYDQGVTRAIKEGAATFPLLLADLEDPSEEVLEEVHDIVRRYHAKFGVDPDVPDVLETLEARRVKKRERWNGKPGAPPKAANGKAEVQVTNRDAAAANPKALKDMSREERETWENAELKKILSA